LHIDEVVKINNLYHGTNQSFKSFDDKFLGKAAGIGNIKAHWFASDGRNPTKAAKQYGEKLDKNNVYIYKVFVEVKSKCVVNSDDRIYDQLDTSQKSYLRKNKTRLSKRMTFQELINENEESVWNTLISIDILVIRNWTPDNSFCREYLAVLTTSKKDLCLIEIEKCYR